MKAVRPSLGAGHQRAGVRKHDRVVVDVQDPALRRDALGDLVHVVQRRDPGADVEELADAGLADEVVDRPDEEDPLRAHHGPDRRDLRRQRLGDRPVGGEVVLAAEPVVVDPGRLRHRRVDLRVVLLRTARLCVLRHERLPCPPTATGGQH